MQFTQLYAARADNGISLPGAQVTIVLTGTLTQATLFDVNGAPISNPLTADGSGAFGFAVADGVYDMTIATSSYTQQIIKFSIFDVSKRATNNLSNVDFTTVDPSVMQALGAALLAHNALPGLLE